MVYAQDEAPPQTTQTVFDGTITHDTPSVIFDLNVRRSYTTVTLNAVVSSGDMTPTLAIVDEDGVIITQSSGANLQHIFASYGDYVIQVGRRDENTTGEFSLTVNTAEEEIEANVIGIIDDETPYISQTIFVRQNSTTVQIDLKEITAGLDTKLYLVDDRTSTIVAENDDRQRGDTSSFIEFPQAARGNYTIIATRYGDADGRTSGEFMLNYNFIEPSNTVETTYGVTAGALLDNNFPVFDEPRPHTGWTILAYYGGDTNLEDGIIQDMNEFEIAGSDENVRVIVLLDRSPEYDTSNGDWSTARLFEIGPASNDSGGARSVNNPDGEYPPTLDTPTLKDLGTVDTGYGETFAQYLVWGIRNYPSDHYVIAMGSHGAGWQGLITDYTADSILTMPELEQALQLAQNEIDGGKFPLLINDACLMSSVEYYDIMSKYFDYSIASAEIVVNPGHDMTLFTGALQANWENPDFSAIGAELIDYYIDVDVQARPGSDTLFLTSAITDLNNFDPVVVAVEDFAAVVNERSEVRSFIIGAARANTYTYSHFMRGNTKIDLRDFMRRIIENPNADEEMVAAAQVVINTLEEARIYQNGGERVIDRVGYYNIYFPEDSGDFDDAYFYQTPLPEWSRMLRNYYNAVTPNPWIGDNPFHTPISPRITITNQYPETEAASLVNPAVIEVEIVGRNISYGEVTYDYIQPDGQIVRLSRERILTRVEVDGEVERLNLWDTGIQQMSLQWDVALPVISDGTVTNPEMLLITDESASLEARYCDVNKDCADELSWDDIVITFDLDGNLQRVVTQSNNNALGVIDIHPGSTVQTYQNTVTPDGRVVLEPGNTYTWGSNTMTWAWHPAQDGEYNLGVQITAFGGTTGFATTPITVNNTDVPADIRAFTRERAGFVVPYPEDWVELTLFSNVDRASDESGTYRVQIYLTTLQTDMTLESLAVTISETYGFEITSSYTEIEIAGVPAVEFDLSAPPYTGRAFAVMIPGSRFGNVFSSEATDGNFDAEYDLLKTYTHFFDPSAVTAARNAGREWTRARYGESGTIRFPIRVDWTAVTEEDGVWTTYYPNEAPDEDTFISMSILPITSNVESIGWVISNLVTGYALEGAESLLVTGNRTYYGAYHTWDTTLYDVVRDGVSISGRIYTTTLDNQTYVVWAEAPKVEDDGELVENVAVFRDIFEPTIDGYTIP